jgi:hypothetical protein
MARKCKRRRTYLLPKGAYRLPTGGYMTNQVAQPTPKNGLVIRSVYRDEPDIRKLAWAVIELLQKQMLEQRPDESNEREVA